MSISYNNDVILKYHFETYNEYLSLVHADFTI